MEIDLVQPSELGAEELSDWRTIQQSSSHLYSPFLSPEFALATEDYRPGARVGVISDGGQVIGYFPHEQRGRRFGAAMCAGHNDAQGILLRSGAFVDTSELLRSCGLSIWEFTHLVAQQPTFDPFVRIWDTSPVMDLSDGFDAFTAGFQSRTSRYKTFARKERKLAREVGELRFEYDSRDVGALAQVLRWKSSQYRRNGWDDRFSAPGMREFVERIFETRTFEFAGILSMLYAGDVPIAGHFGMCANGVMAHWYPSYDIEYRSYAPGILMHLALAESACAAGIQQVEMGPGGEDYKQWLCSREIPVGRGRAARRSAGGAWYSVRLGSTDYARELIVANPKVRRVASGVRSRYLRFAAAPRYKGLSRRGIEPDTAREMREPNNEDE